MRRLGVTLRALASHWRRHPLELLTLVVGLAAATALWSGVQALNAEARASYARAEALLGADRLARVVAVDGGALTTADFAALRRAGWPVSPALEGAVPLPGGGTLRLVGVDPLSLPREAGELGVGPGGARAEDFLAPPYLGLVAPGEAARLAGAPGLPPLAEADAVPPGAMVVDIAAAERLLGRPGAASHLVLGPGPERALPEALAGRLEVRRPEPDAGLGQLTASFHLNLSAFGFLSFVVGLFIVYAAIGLAFERRRPTLRSLRACGVSARALAAALAVELTGLALVAGLAGVAVGYLVAAQLLPDMAASLRGLYGAALPGTLALDPRWWAAGMAMSVAGALAAGATSLWRAWRLPVLAAAQPRAWRAAHRRDLRLKAAAGAIALAAAALAWALGGGLAAGFAVLGGVLVGAALVLPALLAAALGVAEGRARGPVARWFWADGRQQIGGLSLALMALLIALAVNVGVGAMVESFRRTFTDWIDRRLAAELYVGGRDTAEGAAMAEWLADRPEVTAVLPVWRAASRLGGAPVEVYGFRDHATYRDGWPLLAAAPGAWDAVAAGEAAMVSEQLARRAGLGLGDALVLPTPGGAWDLRVAGVHPDYGNPLGQVMVAADALAARFPEADRGRFGVRVDPAAVPALAAELTAAFGLAPDRMVDQASLKAASLQVFERTFAATAALNALTLGVAGVALLTSLLTLSDLRLAQAAPLWAMGVTRRRLAALEVARTLALAGLTALAALPAGLAVAWVLTAVVNVEAFGWRLPVRLFPVDALRLCALALATAALAALWPALRLGRAAPLDLLRRFSNER